MKSWWKKLFGNISFHQFSISRLRRLIGLRRIIRLSMLIRFRRLISQFHEDYITFEPVTFDRNGIINNFLSFLFRLVFSLFFSLLFFISFLFSLFFFSLIRTFSSFEKNLVKKHTISVHSHISFAYSLHSFYSSLLLLLVTHSIILLLVFSSWPTFTDYHQECEPKICYLFLPLILVSKWSTIQVNGQIV